MTIEQAELILNDAGNRADMTGIEKALLVVLESQSRRIEELEVMIRVGLAAEGTVNP
jgi:hypothetical protein